MNEKVDASNHLKRASNFELLRIISIIIIVARHYALYTYADVELYTLPVLNRVLLDCMNSGGQIGVNCFILISGYFYNRSHFSWKKLINLWFEIFFFSIVLSLTAVGLGIADFNIKNLLLWMLPISSSQYWFLSCYLLLYFISPYLKRIIDNVEKKDYLVLLGGLLLTLSIIPTFIQRDIWASNMAWFVTLYLIGAYIKKHNVFVFAVRKLIVPLVFCVIGVCGCVIALDYLKIDNIFYFVFPAYKIPVFVCSMCVFLLFKNLSIQSNRLINQIASYSLGIYIIHNNEQFRDAFWFMLLGGNAYADSPYLVVHAVLGVTIVVLICVAATFVYQKTVDPLFKLIAYNKVRNLRKGEWKSH